MTKKIISVHLFMVGIYVRIQNVLITKKTLVNERIKTSMTDFIFSQAAYDFINAWKVYDAAALRQSTAADVALKNGKPYYMPFMTLKAETDEYVRTKEIFAEELGINHVHLLRALLELQIGRAS